jgi:mRNA interferase HigB
MRIIAKRTLREHWDQVDRRDSEESLKAWHQQVRRADWAEPADVKATYGTASILRNSRACFNIAGNKYRLVTHINYSLWIVFIRFVGTHEEYDRINAHTI